MAQTDALADTGAQALFEHMEGNTAAGAELLLHASGL